MADAAEKSIERLISNNAETLKTVRNFKYVLSELLQWASESNNFDRTKYPAYIFIDELDRCRPTFAIELLERVKHFFDVDGCIFVIATDTQQLTHSVKAIYGEGFSADRYIKRFFDAEFTLDNSDVGAWIKSRSPNFEGLNVFDLNISLAPHTGQDYFHDDEPVEPSKEAIMLGEHNFNKIQAILFALAKTFKSKLRELDKILKEIDAIGKNQPTPKFHIFWAAYLCFLKTEDSDLYEMAVNGKHIEFQNNIHIKFPPADFYFGTTNTDIHNIFTKYIELYRGGQHHAKRLRQQPRNQNQPDYISAIEIDFCNHFEGMSTYPSLVSLAHRID